MRNSGKDSLPCEEKSFSKKVGYWEAHKVRYERPSCDDICVIFCYFSPVRYAKPLENFNTVQSLLTNSLVPHYSAELLLGDQEPVTKSDFVFRTRSAMFYKEAIWNTLANYAPSQFRKFVFIDSDIVFSEKNWVDLCSYELEQYDLIQPAEECFSTNHNKFKPSIAKGVTNGDPKITVGRYHPGYATAVRRDWFERVGGFFAGAVMGSGDAAFWCSVASSYGLVEITKGKPWPMGAHKVHRYPGAFEYAETIRSNPPRVSYLKGVIAYHFPHGNFEARKYATRSDAFTDTEFNSTEIGVNGLMEWRADSSAQSKAMAYFSSREEDGPEETASRLNLIWSSFDKNSVPMRCISLKRAHERRDRMNRMWRIDRGVDFRWFDAYDKLDNLVYENGADGGVLQYNSHEARAIVGRDLSQGERACRLSHFVCVNKMLEEHPYSPIYLLFEDDAEPLFSSKDDLVRRIVYGFYEHPDLDLMLCHDIGVSPKIKKNGMFSVLFDLHPKVNGPWSSVCMALSRRGMDKYIQALGTSCPVDWWRLLGGKMSIACLVNNLVQHRLEGTYIGNEFRITKRPEL